MTKKVIDIEFRGKDSGVMQTMLKQAATSDQLKRKYLELSKAANTAGRAGNEGLKERIDNLASQVRNKAGRITGGKTGGSGGGSSGGSQAGGFLQELRETTGTRSTIGQLGRILAGGGFVGGLTIAAKAIGDAADKAKELAKQFQAGKLSAGQLAGEVVKTVPVVGSLVDAFDKIQDLASGSTTIRKLARFVDPTQLLAHGLNERAYANQTNQEAATRDTVSGSRIALAEAQKESQRKTADAIREASRAKTRLGLDGNALAIFDANAQGTDKQSEIEEKRKEELASLAARQAEQFKKLSDIGGEARLQAEVEIERDIGKAKADVNARYDQLSLAERSKTDAALAELVRKSGEETTRIIEQYGREQANDARTYEQERLKVLGFGLSAEVGALQAAAEEKKRILAETLAEQKKNVTASDAARLDAAAAQERDAIDSDTDRRTKLQVYNAEKDTDARLLELQGQLGDKQAAADSRRLALNKSITDEIKTQHQIMALAGTASEYDTAANTVQKLLASANAGNDRSLASGQLELMQAQAAAGDDLAAAELRRIQLADELTDKETKLLALMKDQNATAEARARAGELVKQLESTKTADIDDQLKKQRESLLSGEANDGRTPQDRRTAKQQLEELKLQDEYKKRAAAFQSIINNPAATAEQKAEAAANLKGFAAQAGREFDAAVGPEKLPIGKKTFDLEERGAYSLLTGVAAGAAARDPQQQVARTSEQSLKVQQKLLDSVDALMRFLTAPNPQGPPPSPVFNGGV